MVIIMAKLRMAHASTHGARKPPGPKKKKKKEEERLNDGDNNGQATHGARKDAWRTQAAWAKMDPFYEEKATLENQLFYAAKSVRADPAVTVAQLDLCDSSPALDNHNVSSCC